MSKQTKQELQEELAAVKAEHEKCPEIKAATKYEQYLELLKQAPRFEQKQGFNTVRAYVDQNGILSINDGGHSGLCWIQPETVPAFLQWCADLRGDATPTVIKEIQTETETLPWWVGFGVGVLVTACGFGTYLVLR